MVYELEVGSESCSSEMLQEQLDALLADGEATSQQQQLDKLDSALQAIPSLPGSRDRALEVVGEFVLHTFTVTESGGDGGGGAKGVEGVKRAVATLSRLVDHSPVHWSSVLLKWLLAVLKEVTATKRAPSASIDSSVKFWVANTVTQPLCALLRTCVDVLLPLDVSSAVALPLEQLLGQSTHSEWIFAYLMSLHPAVLVPHLLQALVSGQVVGSASAFQVLEFAAQTYGRATVERSLVQLFQATLKGEDRTDAGAMANFFHQLLLHSTPTLHLVAPALLEGCRAVDVYDLTVRVTSKGFSADVLPGLVSCIVGLPGNQLRGALRLLLDCHAHWEEQRVGQKEQDEGMEEGELPDNEEEGAGNLQGIDPISRIMNQLLHRIHDVQVPVLVGAHHKAARSNEVLELLTRLQDCAPTLVQWYLQDKGQARSSWLLLLLTLVCRTSPDLRAAQTLAHALCLCRSEEKLVGIVGVISEVQALKVDILHSVMASLPNEPDLLQQGFHNLDRLLVATQHQVPSLRAPLTAALHASSHRLAEGLRTTTSPCSVLALMAELKPATLPPRAGVAVVGSLLDLYFTTALSSTKKLAQGMEVVGGAELTLSRTLAVIASFVKSSAALTSLVCQRITKTLTQPEVGDYLTQDPPLLSPVRVLRREPPRSILTQHLARPSAGRPSQEVDKNPHRGTLGSRRMRSLSLTSRGFASSDTQSVAIGYCLEQMLALVYECCHGNSDACSHFVVGILSCVAPAYPPGPAPLVPPDEVQRISVEWGLGIKRGLESRPIFWHMLHLIAEEDATSVVQFHGVALSLCSLLSGHWQQSRVGSTTEQPRELEATCSLLELCRKACWLPHPLSRIDGLFELVTPYEAHLLLGSVQEYLKDHPPPQTGSPADHKRETASRYLAPLRSVLRHNATQLGHLFTQYYPSTSD